MNCTRVTEFLPWLANGTLPEPEQSLVRAHLAACSQCRQAFEETRLMLVAAQSHLPVEALLDYAAEGHTGDYDPVLWEKHLAGCAACAEQMQLVSASYQALTESVPHATAQAVVLPQAGTARRPPAKRARRSWFPASSFSPQLFAVACLLCALALGYAFYSWRASNHRWQADQIAQNQRLSTLETQARQQAENYQAAQQEIERLKNDLAAKENKLAAQERELAQTKARPPARATPPGAGPARPAGKAPASPAPEANVVVLDVFPAVVERSAPENQNRLAVPRQATAVTLLLNARSPFTASRYALELLDSGGRVVWRNNNVRGSSAGDLAVHLPAQMLRTGAYTINIYALAGGQRARIETYQIFFSRSAS
jgi:hypothetical protein